MLTINFTPKQAYLALMVGVVGVLGCIALALVTGHNGAVFTSGVTVVGLLVGWAVGRSKKDQ